MADLSVEFAGLTIKNPIITASSSLGNHIDKLKRLESAGAGAVTTKLISSAPQPPEHNFPYRMGRHSANWMVAGEQNLDLEYGVNLVKAAKRELSIPVIANFVGTAADIDSWVHDALALQEAGADALEMDLYAPMAGPGTDVDDHPEAGHGYLSICAFPEQLTAVTSALLEAIDIPVIPKMNPGVASVVDVARALIDGGATSIVMSNCAEGSPGVDIHNGGRPKIAFAEKIFALPMSGRYLFPMQSRHLALLKSEIPDEIQFGTGGGVYDWDEIVQRIMLGGQIVQLCSTIYENGPRIISESIGALHRYMEEYGYSTVEEFRGKSLETVGTRMQTMIRPAVARIKDPLALLPRAAEVVAKVQGDCLAMTMGPDCLPVIDESRCTGCGWCVHHAGNGSIEMVQTRDFISDLDLAPTS